MTPTVVDIAYAAGFFDGEGSVVMNYQDSKKGTRSYGVHTSVMNTDRPILEWLQSLFGGKIYAHSFAKKPANWRPGYQWHINDNPTCESFLLAMRPYLRIKASLADNALLFFRLKHQLAKGKRTPPDLQARFRELHAIHGALIVRGRVDPIVLPEVVESPQLEMLRA